MPLDILAFVRKWNAATLTERSAAQQHFRDLCEALGVPHPTESDEIGASYTFEKRVSKTGGGEGFADVWRRGFFAWEYKSKGGDLRAAYKQINEYHEALENPPLLIVSDFVRFEVHTKFENLPSRTYAFTLDDLLVPKDTATSALPPIEVLRHVFGDFNQLRPNVASARVTEAAATDFLHLARRLERLTPAAGPGDPSSPTVSSSAKVGLGTTPADGHSKEQIAHFLMRLVFCLFADSVELIPNHAFRRLVESGRASLRGFNKKLPVLFAAMSGREGFFGADDIRWFNGGLFTDSTAIELDAEDMRVLIAAAQHDWSHIEPAIFGTLFERSLDEAKRAIIGAHYTSTDDILLLIEPVVMTPLRRRWESVQVSILAALAEESATDPGAPSFPVGENCHPEQSEGSASLPQPPARLVRTAKAPKRTQPTLNLNRPALTLLQDWAAELTRVRILDPACGSGNFLYVALKRLLDLWHEARVFGIRHGLTIALDPIPNPGQLFGIEIDFYAHEIASIVVWIGFLQWKHDHGIKDEKEPLLEKLTNIEHADAIMRYDAEGNPYEPEWPEAEYIVGNPPFLGGKLLRRELGDTYVDDVFALYKGRVKAESDLVVYWFEKARAQLEAAKVTRAGLIATQSIRGGANRAVLERIQQTGTIFWAWSDRKWMLQGAAVHVSMVAFERNAQAGSATEPSAEGAASYQPGVEPQVEAPTHPRAEGPLYSLDGNPVPFINPDLTTGSNAASAVRLKENVGICFMGTTKVGAFEISPEVARKMLNAPLNPNGRPNSDVVRPWINAKDFSSRPREFFVIDFGVDLSADQAALYEVPFEYLKHHVQNERSLNRRENYAGKWWLHGEPRPELRKALVEKARYILTPGVSKHRVFAWFDTSTIPDHAIFGFARDDDYFFGVLHSLVHEIWARSQGTQLREVESGFRYTPKSTFDTFPFPWPPGQEPAEAEDPRVAAIAAAARELVRLRDAWLNPPGISEADLKDRTFTKLYNKRPHWLSNAHRALDETVFAAYHWPSTLSDQEVLARLITLNHERATTERTS